MPAVGPVVAEQGPNHGYLESPYAEDDWELWACLLLDAFGTRSPNVANAFMSQLADLCPDVWVEGESQGLDGYRFEQAISIVKALKPRNEAESALCVQAVSLHLAMMKVGSRLRNSSHVDPHSAAALAQLGKAYAKQVETIASLRNRKSSRQTIKVVKNVTVNYRDEKHLHVPAPGGGSERNQCHAAEPLRARARDAELSEERPSLPCPNTFGTVVPLARREG